MGTSFPLHHLIAFASLLSIGSGAGQTTAPVPTQPVLPVGTFSRMTPGMAIANGWKPLAFEKIPRHTTYRLISDTGSTVVEAQAHASASGLTHAINVDLAKFPVLRWRWKIERLIEKADVHAKRGDDYPARLYVTFAYDPQRVGILERAKFEAARLIYGEYPPVAALNYVWDGKAPVGTNVPNAYIARARMIVVQSGPALVGEWVTEERNVLEDYRNAFGGTPPPVTGIAIMTDTDNTGESARAFFGDIEFARRPTP
jgi:hypothetical protein